MKIALAGNPNSGKTTLFNALTGRNEKVGNWAGVTVDKKEHSLKKSLGGDGSIAVVDLPGAYSMSPFTSEESITSSYVLNERPDVIINIVDATNLSRSLFFTTQLLELGIPAVVALNKTDLTEKKQTEIDTSELSAMLGCPAIEIVSTSASGIETLVECAKAQAAKGISEGSRQTVTDTDSAKEADRLRFERVKAITERVEKRKTLSRQNTVHDSIDAVLTNRWVGIPIFAVIMFLVFGISQAWLGPVIAEGLTLKNGTEIPGLVTLIEWFGEWVGAALEGADPFLTSMIVDGLIGGVGAVVGFLPLVMIMYFLIALLEDCGYMARATVVLDPIFKKVGLSGKSVIPFVVGTGCAVPGVMACRTIRDEKERRAAAMLTPFMPCGAKLPVISLFAGAFFERSQWVGVTMYFAGIIIILLCAMLVKLLSGYRGKKTYFIMEIPEYKLPSVKRALLSMCQRGWSYIVKAGTVILVCNFAVQLMQSFNFRFQPVENASESILAAVAAPFAYVIAPIVGVVAWQLAAAVITGFIAKENVVGTLAVCFVGLENLIDTEELAMLEGAGADVAAVFAITKVAALAYLAFNLFSPPCFAAIGAMNAEIGNKKWLFAGVGLQLSVGYTVAFLIFFFGTLFTTRDFGQAWMPVLGFAIVLAIVAVFTAAVIIRQRRFKSEYDLKIKERG